MIVCVEICSCLPVSALFSEACAAVQARLAAIANVSVDIFKP
jgi:hypothetical protein